METIDLDKILLANNIGEILNTDSLKKIFINILKDKYKELSSIDIDELFNFDYSKKFASEKYQELDTLLELIKLENVDKLPNIRLHLNLQEQQHYHYQNMQYHLIKLNSILQLF